MPLLLIVKFIIDGGCGVLNAWGGAGFLAARRYIMPVVIGIGVSLASVWWAGFMVLPVMGTLCIGYSGGKWLVRGGWLALQAVIIGLGTMLTNHLDWWLYAPYVVVAFTLGATLYDIDQIVGDIIFGVWLGVVVFLVH